MKKWKMRMFKVKPYEVTLDTGKKPTVDNEVVVGNINESGVFYGAVFEEGRFMGEVRYEKDEWENTYRGEEIPLPEGL